MTSPLMEYLGIAGLDIAWLFIGIFVVLLILLVLIIVQFAKYKKLKKKYDKFMKGKDGKSLERILSLCLRIINLSKARARRIERTSAIS